MKTLLKAAMVSASIFTMGAVCQAQVYSSFSPGPHRADEIQLWGCSYESGSYSSYAEWYISTNTLAKQVHWDGLSTEVPLSTRKACALALPHVREAIPTIQSWSVDSVLIRRLSMDYIDLFPDVWYYQIIFTPSAPEDRIRADYQANYCAATQIVLMDGTVLPQTVQKKK